MSRISALVTIKARLTVTGRHWSPSVYTCLSADRPTDVRGYGYRVPGKTNTTSLFAVCNWHQGSASAVLLDVDQGK